MKRLSYQLSEVAIVELGVVQDRLWQERPGRDALLMQKLESVIERLRIFPESGEARPEFGNGLRSVPLWRYVIFYRVLGDLVIIEHVIHGSRDIQALILDNGLLP